MFRPTRPSSVLQSSERLNIVCVWRMLRSHHLANKLYMGHKLRVSRYGGERNTGLFEMIVGVLTTCHIQHT